jgi:hypothetical protein
MSKALFILSPTMRWFGDSGMNEHADSLPVNSEPAGLHKQTTIFFIVFLISCKKVKV